MPVQLIEQPVDIGFYESPELPVAAQECLNFQVSVPMTQGASTSGALSSAPGYGEWVNDFGVENVYEGILHKEILYVATNDSLYSISQAKVVTLLGSWTTVGRPQLASNGEVIMVNVPNSGAVSGSAYFYDETNGFRAVSDSVFVAYQAEDGGVLSVTSGNGYFICCTKKVLFHSSLSTDPDWGTSFPALAFASGESRPDDNVRVHFFKGQLILFGKRSFEIWKDVATEPFAYYRIDGATQDKGLLAHGLMAESDNTIFFVGAGPDEAPSVWRITGGSPQKVSTDAIDQIVGDYGTGTSGYLTWAWSYSYNGHFFVGFAVNRYIRVGDDRSELTRVSRQMVYDITASALKGRSIWTERDAEIQFFIAAYGLVLAGTTGKIGVVGSKVENFHRTEYHSNFGESVPYVFAGAYLQAEGQPVFVYEVKLRCETGTATGTWDADPGDIEPMVLLECSDDGGYSFESYGESSMGKAGERAMEVKWNRLGRVPNTRIFRFSVTTTAKLTFLDVQLQVERGRR